MSPQELREKLPPQNVEAEQSVLGALLIDKDAIVKVADIVRPEDFYKDTNGLIYGAMLELYNQRQPIDILSLSNRLEEKGQLETVGGRSYLTELANIVPTASHVANYGEIVQKKATLRRLITTAGDIADLGFEEEQPIENVLDEAETRLFAVSQKYLKQNFSALRSLLGAAFERIDRLHQQPGGLRGLPTGFRDLDNKLAGLQKSDLIVLAARPSMGKTSLALDIARHVAAREKKPVGLFSLEMSREQVVDRMLASEANVDLWKLRTGRLKSDGELDDFTRLGAALNSLNDAPLFIDDSAIANIMEIRTKARRLQAEHGLGLLIVDYLQLMEGQNQENRVQEVAQITRALKGIARELEIPVLALSQLSRATEQRTTPIPQLRDLRESGSIEQDADVVLFIYREEMYKKETQRAHIAEIHIAKHRNGPTGVLEMWFDQEKASFRTMDKQTSGEIPPF